MFRKSRLMPLSTGLGTWIFGILSLAALITEWRDFAISFGDELVPAVNGALAIAKMAGSIEMIGPVC